ncbi:16S rRNA (cytidine(1402)-2'-O)-methyltransferase [bacterium]|nr:16S rRNA (cytidine(1402)-2'-O)-methyltransferase [bacterium]
MKESFFIVPTPIGNLEDITLRALEVLKTVDYIACEDTRVTQKLLNHYKIDTRTFAYHKFNEKQSVEKILEMLKSGNTIALVSDAGTPLICDPGSILISELRKNGIKITSLAGASALTIFLSQVPNGDEPFSFIGFMPRKEKQIIDIILKNSSKNMVFYDSPNRLLKTLEVLKEFNPNLKIAIGRELTKLFEEVVVKSVSDMHEYYSKNILKGEIVGMVYKQSDDADYNLPVLEIEKLKSLGFSSRDISLITHALYDVNKNEVINYLNKRGVQIQTHDGD